MNCLRCGDSTENPKFCSRSCAATYNNKKYPKRHTISEQWVCVKCGGHKDYRATQCLKCKRTEDKERQDNLTLAEATHNNGNARVKWSQIRKWARRDMERAGRLSKCEACDFTARVEVSHIVSIANFPETALIGEINAQDNMRGLCPNHHTLHEMALSSRQSG